MFSKKWAFVRTDSDKHGYQAGRGDVGWTGDWDRHIYTLLYEDPDMQAQRASTSNVSAALPEAPCPLLSPPAYPDLSCLFSQSLHQPQESGLGYFSFSCPLCFPILSVSVESPDSASQSPRPGLTKSKLFRGLRTGINWIFKEGFFFNYLRSQSGVEGGETPTCWKMLSLFYLVLVQKQVY